MSLPHGPGPGNPEPTLAREAVLHGAVVPAALCGPLALANWAAQSGRTQPSAGVAALFSLLILVSAGVGGWKAQAKAPEHPLPNGAAAAAAGYLVVQELGRAPRRARVYTSV